MHTDDPTPGDLPRFEVVSRRAVLRRIATLGALAAVPGLAAACATGDADVFAGATTTPPGPTDDPAIPTESNDTPTTAGATAVPAGSQLLVSFTYAAASGGRIENPYIAVWVEDLDGELVAPISLWVLQSDKGRRWLDDLTRWYGLDTSSFDAVSSATRTPGEHTVAWDGTTLEGAAAAAGNYVLCIEAAREHGPHSLITASTTLGGDVDVTLPDDGELTGATAQLVDD